MDRRLAFSLTLYCHLAHAYPHEFRMLYGEDLDRLGEDAIPEVSRHYGIRGLLRLLADVALQLPAMYLREIRQDAFHALRVLAKSPGFTSVAVLTLAVGIGMCCAILSEIQSIVGPPPGIREPASLATFHWSQASYPYFERYRSEHRTVAAATAFLGPVPFTVALAGDKSARAERFYGHLVSPEYFSALGVTPALGRLFTPEAERPGMPPVVVVSDRFWRTQLGEDPSAVGSWLRLNGRTATIIGIGPRDFLGIWPGNPADLFVPVTCGATLAPELSGDPLHRSDREIFRAVFRLAPGTTIRAAETAVNRIRRELDRENGIESDQNRDGRMLRLMPAGTMMYITPEQHAFVNTFNVVLWALVLSLVCANLANLMLARGSQRRREIAVRLSLGASRPRLIRQFLTESVLLAFAGGLAGIALAYGITHIMSSLPIPSPTPQQFSFRPDLRVLALTMALALTAGIGFGLAPALSLVRIDDIGRILKDGGQPSLRDYRRFGSRNLFVVCQMTASVMLLLVTWFVATGFLDTSRFDAGFDTGNLILMSLDPVRDGRSAAETSALFAALPDALSRVNGVRNVSLTGSVPFASLGADQTNTRVSSQAGDGLHAVFRERVGANYFATLGVPLLLGREFDGRDQRRSDSAVPAIVNQTAARELFGGDSPVGKRIRENERNYTVVGLTRDVPSGFLKASPVATLFLPLTDEWFRKNPAEGITILLRSAASRSVLASVRNHVASLHPDLTVFNVRTMHDDLGRLNSLVAWQGAIYITLGLFALLLACIGLGGVTAYAVVRRRKEIGIRMALGAHGRHVQVLVLREGMALVTVGTVLGLAGAFAIARVFSAYSDTLARTFAQRPASPMLVFGTPLVLAGLAMLACYLPARRATAIDPMTALREE
jgi:macrolide transport system ATP-binding/permease protein